MFFQQFLLLLIYLHYLNIVMKIECKSEKITMTECKLIYDGELKERTFFAIAVIVCTVAMAP